jgi:hypothetical protein
MTTTTLRFMRSESSTAVLNASRVIGSGIE